MVDRITINTNLTLPDGSFRKIFENCVPWQTYDYFFGSEVWFPLTFLVLALFVPGKENYYFFYIYKKEQRPVGFESG
jgi:hypothetical protein